MINTLDSGGVSNNLLLNNSKVSSAQSNRQSRVDGTQQVAQVSQLSRENSGLTTENSQLKADERRLESQNQILTNENQALRGNLRELQRDLADSRSQGGDASPPSSPNPSLSSSEPGEIINTYA